MSLETEIKKLTDAVVALTTTMQVRDGGAQPVQTPAHVAANGAVIAPPAPTFVPPPVAGPAYAPPAVAAPSFAPPVSQAAPAMGLPEVQSALAGIMQRLGPSSAPELQRLIAQYGNGATRLSEVPAHNLPGLVAAAQALVQ